MSKTVFMRGLNNFIQDVRDCKNQEQEARRVEKELAKIREKFGDDKGLSGYDKRKYVWKLLYIHMLGYNIDFGHKQACDLIPKAKYKDKQVGYMACAILLNENDEFLRLSINGIHQDLISRNEAFECLALNFVGTVGGKEMAEALVPDILKLLTNGSSRPLVKKRAALCLLRMMRRTPPGQEVVHADTFCSILNDLLEERDLGLLLSAVTLLLGILSRNGPAGYEPTQSRLLRILERLTTIEEGKGRDVPQEYLFYGVPCPWLQSKTLRSLQFFTLPDVAEDRALLKAILDVVISTVPTNFKSNPNKANALHSITFEGIQLILLVDCGPELREKAIESLASLLEAQQANVVYLALETLSRLTSAPDILVAMRAKKGTITAALKGPDAGVRKKALDLLFATCDANVAPDLVAELLDYLNDCDYNLKEDLVLKIAVLAEKYAPTVQWYVDSALALLERGGDFASDDIWQRTVQLVTNNDAMQTYAAREVVQVLRRGSSHESVVATAAYLLGEYGRLIKSEVSVSEQFSLLHGHLATASGPTRNLLMTAFMKLFLQDPTDAALKASVVGLFERSASMMDAELQQRAAEYLALAKTPVDATSKFVLPMPKWPERESTLLRQLQKSTGNDDDAAAAAGHAALSPAASGGTETSTALAGASAAAATAAATAAAAAAGTAPAAASGDLLLSMSSSGPPPTTAVAASPAASTTASTADPFAQLASPRGGEPAAATAPTQAAAAAPAPATSTTDMLAGLFAAPAAAAAAAAAPVAAAPPAAPSPSAATPPAAAAYAATAQPAMPTAAPAMAAAAASVAAFQAAPAAPAPAPVAAPTAAVPAPMAPAYSGSFSAAAAAPPPGAAPPPAAADPFAGWSPAATTAPAPAAIAATAAPAAYTAAYAVPTAFAAAPSPQAAGFATPPQPAFAAPPAAAAPPPAARAVFPDSPAPFPGAAPAAPAPTAAPSAGFSAQSDPFGGDSAFGPPTPTFAAAQPTVDLNACFNALLYKDRGVIYEDQYLQVGIQMAYRGGQCDATLFLGNKQPAHALTSVAVVVSPSSSVGAVLSSAAPTSVTPGQQAQVPLRLTCMAPVVDVPVARLQYVLGNVNVQQDLRMPVSSYRFLVPEPAIAKELFFEQWKVQGSAPFKAQEMVARDHGQVLNNDQVLAVMHSVGLGASHGYLDPSPYNEAGAAYFTMGAPGAETRTLVMCRVEGNPQNMAQFRVTVVSALPALSESTKNLLVMRMRA